MLPTESKVLAYMLTPSVLQVLIRYLWLRTNAHAVVIGTLWTMAERSKCKMCPVHSS